MTAYGWLIQYIKMDRHTEVVSKAQQFIGLFLPETGEGEYDLPNGMVEFAKENGISFNVYFDKYMYGATIWGDPDTQLTVRIGRDGLIYSIK